MSFDTVEQFEQTIAEFYNAPYAVAVDCCTHAVELALRYINPQHTITVPKHTYVSIPMTMEKLNLNWDWKDEQWSDYYYIGHTNIVDAAVYFKAGGYIPNTFMCLSFQFRKPLNLGRGGAILCTSLEEYTALKKMSYDGRLGNQPWAEQDIDSIGYHYYMTPETAQLGMDKLPVVASKEWPQWDWNNYPDLSKLKVFDGK